MTFWWCIPKISISINSIKVDRLCLFCVAFIFWKCFDEGGLFESYGVNIDRTNSSWTRDNRWEAEESWWRVGFIVFFTGHLFMGGANCWIKEYALFLYFIHYEVLFLYSLIVVFTFPTYYCSSRASFSRMWPLSKVLRTIFIWCI